MAKKKPRRRTTRRKRTNVDLPPANPLEKIQAPDVRLKAGKGSADRGAGPGGHYWHIYLNETRVGHVYICFIDEGPFGRHASIQIHINKKHQARGIGSVAYELACRGSNYDEIFATMRKSNVGSRRAAARAGFVEVDDMGISQVAMKWTRS